MKNGVDEVRDTKITEQRLHPVTRRTAGLSALAVSALSLQAGRVCPETSLSILCIQMTDFWSDSVQIYHSSHSGLFAFTAQNNLEKELRKVSHSSLNSLENPILLIHMAEKRQSQKWKEKQTKRTRLTRCPASTVYYAHNQCPSCCSALGPSWEAADMRSRQVRGVRVKIWGRSTGETDSWMEW